MTTHTHCICHVLINLFQVYIFKACHSFLLALKAYRYVLLQILCPFRVGRSFILFISIGCDGHTPVISKKPQETRSQCITSNDGTTVYTYILLSSCHAVLKYNII